MPTPSPDVQTMILVHGAFHGGWCWQATAAELTRRGIRVHTPSLTGLGDRRHLFSPSVNLATHVTDIVSLIELEQLEGCVLVGHSYAGNVLTGVADQLRERVAHYVYVDASVPVPGSTRWGWAHLNPDQRDERMASIDGPGHGLGLPSPPASVFGIDDPGLAAAVGARLSPMPRGTYTDPIDLVNGGVEGLRRSYIAASAPAYGNMAATVAWVRDDPEWTFRELAAGHDMMVTHPVELAELLLDLTDAG
jgi:pimeloyl-ACP methyl ester carboxylesterase